MRKIFVTTALGTYEVYDKFFALWLLGGEKHAYQLGFPYPCEMGKSKKDYDYMTNLKNG